MHLMKKQNRRFRVIRAHRDLRRAHLAMTRATQETSEDLAVLYWAATFLIIALTAAIFGFGGIAASAVGIARILFIVFLVLFVVSLLFGGMRRPVI